MKKTGAYLVTYALEQLGVPYTFGIPGVHNTELYDELDRSKQIIPILVTHECGAAFMADAVSRTSPHVGTIITVPAAGVTHAMSGIGEAYLAGIPMLILTSGIRRDLNKSYQLHELDLQKLVKNIVKQTFLITAHDEIIQTLYDAYHVAITDEPGPVFVEIPANILLFEGEGGNLLAYKTAESSSELNLEHIHQAVALLKKAQKPGIFVGWGAREATSTLIQVAELLQAPVSTTLQGLSCFPGNHPLHTGMGFGRYAVPCAEKAFEGCDCLLAVGTRFSEIPTGSFGMPVPGNLIHIDINPAVFNKNYPAKVCIAGDANKILVELHQKLLAAGLSTQPKNLPLQELIHREKVNYQNEWLMAETLGKVNPALFFKTLRELLPSDAILVCDDGNHTFLTAELFSFHQSKTFISPSDFNCMGYAVPAAIGAKLANPTRTVVAIVGDGAFLMTGMETITAATLNLGILFFVFHDGELSQISQGQKIPYNRKSCTTLGEIHVEGVARAVGAAYFYLEKNDDILFTLRSAQEISRTGQPVMVDVNIDYSKPTRFTRGVIKTNLDRFPLREKIRFIQRALWRRIGSFV